MENTSLFDKINGMPPYYKKEIEDYVDYVWDRKINKQETIIPKTGSTFNVEMPLFGAFKGKIWMSPDFDEPLEDFKDYM